MSETTAPRYTPEHPDYQADVARAQNELRIIQELYDATTLLQAVLTFTHETADLLKPELDIACRRLIAARSAMRHAAIIEHVEAYFLQADPPVSEPQTEPR